MSVPEVRLTPDECQRLWECQFGQAPGDERAAWLIQEVERIVAMRLIGARQANTSAGAS